MSPDSIAISNQYSMPVKLVNVSPKVEVEDEKLITFPPEVKGSIEPGSLNHLRLAYGMIWGDNMLDLIKPNTIPACVNSLRLPPNYVHPVVDSGLLSKVSVYLHHSSIQYANSKISFFVWKADNEPEPVLPSNWRRTCNGWSGSNTFDNTQIIRAERIPEPVVVPKPEPVTTTTTKPPTSPEKKKAYLEAERVYAEAKRVYHGAKQAYLADKIAALEEQITQTPN